MNIRITVPEGLNDHILLDKSHRFVNQWNEWRRDSVAPRRSDVRLEHLGEVVSQIAELEFISRDECTYRLVGSNLVALAGVDRTKTNFFDSGPPETRDLRIARFDAVRRQPCGFVATLPTILRGGKTIMREIVGLPVLPDFSRELKAGGNDRLLTISTPLQKLNRRVQVQDSDFIPAAASFHFIDIGGGLPENISMLTSNMPLALA